MNGHEPFGWSDPLGAAVVDGGVNFSLFSRSATGVELVFFDREDDARPVARDRPGPRREPDLPLLARVRARRATPGRSTGTASPAHPTRPAGCASTRRRSCSIHMAARWSSPTATPRGREPRGRQRRNGNEEHRRGPGVVRLGRRRAAAPAVLAHDHLRDARARLHASPELGRGRAGARDLCAG